MEGPLKRGRQTSNFLTTHARLKILRMDKYKLKMKYDKIWGYQNEVSPLNGATKIQTFNNSR